MSAIYYNGVAYSGGGGEGGPFDYELLINKPKINGTTLSKNTSTSDLNLTDNDTLEVEDNKIKIKDLPSLSGDTLILTF